MLNKNLEQIKNKNLVLKLSSMDLKKSSENMSYCMTPTNDYLLMKNDVPIDDIDNPRQAIKDMLKNSIKYEMHTNDIIVVFGIGLGYILDEVYNNYSSRIIVYEPDIDLLHFVLNNIDISTHLASGRVYITSNVNELKEQLSSIYITKDKVEVVYLKNYAVVKHQELLELTQAVYSTCEGKIVDINTITKYSINWLQNSINNITNINTKNIYSLTDLEDKFKGQTALILAAGPSLTENIELIKANRTKYVIFAVNKVVRDLAQHGIIADFIVCLDPSNIKYTLAGLEDYCSKVNCITDFQSDSEIFNYNFKKIFVSFSANNGIAKKLSGYNKQISLLDIGGSATTFALVASNLMGFAKIVFSGLDLAFKDDVMYSTGETINQTSERQISIGSATKDIVLVDSFDGKKIRTRVDYASFIQHFENFIPKLNTKDVVNTTSFGAKINGMKYQRFDEIHFLFSSTATSIILGSVEPFKIAAKEWSQTELYAINSVISILAQDVFSPALVSEITKSTLLYQYMQKDILEVVQSKFNMDLAQDFIANTKNAIKNVIELLRNNNLS